MSDRMMIVPNDGASVEVREWGVLRPSPLEGVIEAWSESEARTIAARCAGNTGVGPWQIVSRRVRYFGWELHSSEGRSK